MNDDLLQRVSIDMEYSRSAVSIKKDSSTLF